MGVAESASDRRTEGRPPFIRVVGLEKHYGGAYALKGVDIDLRESEVHGLIGANGAGKSTLIRALAGLVQPDGGRIEIEGRPVALSGPEEAGRYGLSFIHQELNLVPQFNALQNITLGLPKATRFGFLDWRATRRQAERVAAQIGIGFRLDTPTVRLSTADRWLVTIGKALMRHARMIVMDEPTASLSAKEADRLFQIIRDLKADGVGILYVSHRLDEILELSDRVTTFRDGLKAMEAPRAGLTRGALVRAIVGDGPSTERLAGAAASASTARGAGAVVLSLRNLRRGQAVRGVSFDLHEGEVLALAGLVGAGRTETVRMIFGADQPEGGEIRLRGRKFQPRSPAEAVKAGVALVPEERRAQGLVLGLSVALNANLASLGGASPLPGLPLFSPAVAERRSRAISERLSIKHPGLRSPVNALSGGNQQKVVIGKWLLNDPKLLILDEPSRGVDVGARTEIHRIIRELNDSGVAVLLVSSDIEELPGLCDRVLVMVEGRIAGELQGPAITRDAILHLCYSHAEDHP
jgi:ribose transport system ATP-binding protein